MDIDWLVGRQWAGFRQASTVHWLNLGQRAGPQLHISWLLGQWAELSLNQSPAAGRSVRFPSVSRKLS